jgi:thiamine biosynthesis protein ThiS
MKVKVNGKLQEFLEPLRLIELLKQFQIDENTEGVAVAVDEELVLKCDWKNFILVDGQSVEIVWARQGG